MKKSFGRRIPGLLLTILLSAAMVLFLIGLARTQLFPVKYLLLAGGVCLLFAVIVGLLTRDVKRIGGMILGIILTALIAAAMWLATSYLMDAVNTLNKLTQVQVEIADVGVYVRSDDPAKDLTDATGYNFGIMTELDRENTDTVLGELNEELGTQLKVQELAGLEELVDGLVTDRQVDAIIVNSAYLELLEDMEGYEQMYAQLRELHARQVETVIETVVEEPTVPETQEETNPIEQIVEEATQEEEPAFEPFIVYISGIDSYKSLKAKGRSDVNILAVVNPNTRQVLLLSTPRDYYVPLPNSKGKPDKLTHAGIYGIKVSVGALEMLYDIDIDYYFRVNFSGFEKIIDALGGITVESPQAFKSAEGYSFKKGENKLNGAKALAFARERKAFTSGDRQRGKNQMAVIKAVMNKAMSPKILTKYTDLMDSVSGCFETSMPYDKIAELVRMQLEEGGSWNIVSYSVDGTGAKKKPYSLSTKAYVMVPNQETVDKAIKKINQVLDGKTLK